MYLQCRKEAKVSVETASSILKHGRETLNLFENLEKEPSPTTVVRMITECGYNKKLARWHCAKMCSVGKFLGKSFFEGEIVKASLKIVSSLSLISGLNKSMHELIEALSDGIIEKHEIPIIRAFIQRFRKIQAAVDILELKVDMKEGAA